MKFSAAIVALAAAGASAGNVTITTEVVTAVTTYCPYATQITHNGQTYTVTEATTLTITNCPCTITREITATTTVPCTTGYTNGTTLAPYPTTSAVASTGGVTPTVTPSSPATVPTAGAAKAAVLSGAGLAGVLGLAAFIL